MRNFRKGKISSDDLSAISNRLFVKMTKDDFFKKDKDLFFVLEAASELGFYIRHPESKSLNQFLKEVIDYLGE